MNYAKDTPYYTYTHTYIMPRTLTTMQTLKIHSQIHFDKNTSTMHTLTYKMPRKLPTINYIHSHMHYTKDTHYYNTLTHT